MSEWKDQKQQGAWIWVRWNPGAPQDAWREWGGSNLKASPATGEWDCKVWMPAKNAEEAKQFVEKNVRNNKWVKDAKTEWAAQYAA